jgi:hypothetical protein
MLNCISCGKEFKLNSDKPSRGRPRQKCYECQPDTTGMTKGMTKEQRSEFMKDLKRSLGAKPRVAKVKSEIVSEPRAVMVTEISPPKKYEQVVELSVGDKLTWHSPIMFPSTNENIQLYGHKVVVFDSEPNVLTGKVKVIAKHFGDDPVESQVSHLWREIK